MHPDSSVAKSDRLAGGYFLECVEAICCPDLDLLKIEEFIQKFMGKFHFVMNFFQCGFREGADPAGLVQ
jgi:hypothetical protein